MYILCCMVGCGGVGSVDLGSYFLLIGGGEIVWVIGVFNLDSVVSVDIISRCRVWDVVMFMLG